MATGEAAVVLVIAGKLALFGGLILRGHSDLIAGYRSNVLPSKPTTTEEFDGPSTV